MGRELEFLQAIAKSNPPMPDSVLTALSACVMKERRSARITTLLELAAAVDTPERTRLALLEGLAPKKTSKGNQRITYLAAKPALLNDLSTAKGKLRDQLRALDAVVAWPDKPGVPPPPVVPPLTAEQQQLYDHGKLIYTGLCAACHQPHGAGMEGLAPPLVDSEWVLGNPQTLARIVLHGVSGSIKVSGRTWKLEMPPLGTLQDKDIAGVLTYIRREWEHGKSPVSVEDIAKQRSKDAGRTALWTEKELLAKNKAK
jgi:mono/diheme cytochrome c family protein